MYVYMYMSLQFLIYTANMYIYIYIYTCAYCSSWDRLLVLYDAICLLVDLLARGGNLVYKGEVAILYRKAANPRTLSLASLEAVYDHLRNTPITLQGTGLRDNRE